MTIANPSYFDIPNRLLGLVSVPAPVTGIALTLKTPPPNDLSDLNTWAANAQVNADTTIYTLQIVSAR